MSQLVVQPQQFKLQVKDYGYNLIAVAPQGPAGPQGLQGDPGTPGVGVPAGGVRGRFLVKNSAADYDVAWSNKIRSLAFNDTPVYVRSSEDTTDLFKVVDTVQTGGGGGSGPFYSVVAPRGLSVAGDGILTTSMRNLGASNSRSGFYLTHDSGLGFEVTDWSLTGSAGNVQAKDGSGLPATVTAGGLQINSTAGASVARIYPNGMTVLAGPFTNADDAGRAIMIVGNGASGFVDYGGYWGGTSHYVRQCYGGVPAIGDRQSDGMLCFGGIDGYNGGWAAAALLAYSGGPLVCVEARGAAGVAKVGFLGAAPVARQALSAAATDLASVIALANSIRTALINNGLGG